MQVMVTTVIAWLVRHEVMSAQTATHGQGVNRGEKGRRGGKIIQRTKINSHKNKIGGGT